jgi:hypothetical protein
MLYSQTNYLGAFLNFGNHFYDLWDDAIHKFVSGNLNISKKRTFLPIELGGLGLFQIKEFLSSQKCRWVLLANLNIDAGWKLHLKNCTIQNMLRFCPHARAQLDPTLLGIVEAFDYFKLKFAGSENNYKEMPIFEEKLFTTGVRTKPWFGSDDIINTELEPVLDRVASMRILDLVEPGTDNLISRAVLSARLGTQIPTATYNKLMSVSVTAKIKFLTNSITNGISINTFVNNWKKGSKKIRKIMCKIESKKWAVSHNMIKLASNVETVINLECATKLNQCWRYNFYSNELRTFIFKMNNNTLPVNTVLSHFVRGATRNCTFCNLTFNPDPIDETVFHLFFECEVAEITRNDFFKWLTEDNNFILNRHEFFCCGSTPKIAGYLLTPLWLFKFYLWECRNRNSLPVLTHLKKFVLREVDVMKKLNSNFRSAVDNSTINFSLGRLDGHF